jgi:hypothetical protein
MKSFVSSRLRQKSCASSRFLAKNYLKSFSILISFIINRILSINLQKPHYNKNIQFPSCKDCKHFILDTENIEKGKCDLTYLTSLVTGEKIYNYAIFNRLNVLNCGLDGKFYEYSDYPELEQIDLSKVEELNEESDKNN